MTREEEFDRLPQTIQMRQDLHDPARRIAVREEYKRGLPSTYPDLLEQVQLTEAQRDALFDLLADFQMRHLDIYYAKEPDQRARQKRFQENDQRRNEAVHSLLGPDVLETYRRYQLAWSGRWIEPRAEIATHGGAAGGAQRATSAAGRAAHAQTSCGLAGEDQSSGVVGSRPPGRRGYLAGGGRKEPSASAACGLISERIPACGLHQDGKPEN
jgi:hypothetical protein